MRTPLKSDATSEPADLPPSNHYAITTLSSTPRNCRRCSRQRGGPYRRRSILRKRRDARNPQPACTVAWRDAHGRCLRSAHCASSRAWRHGCQHVRPTKPAIAISRCAHVVLIDPAVRDRGTLLAGLGQGAAAYVLDPSGDGVRQIAQILTRHAGLSTISVLAHGAAATLTLGSAVLDSDRIGSSPAVLRQIGRALAPGGTLQLFACAVAEGAMGRAFVQLLSFTAGVAVAAASRALGGAAAGGNWTLDVRSSSESRLSLGASAPASLPIHADALTAYPHPLAGAGAPPTGFPLDVTNFSTTGASFVRSGNAVISGTALQLTDATRSQAGTAVDNQTFSSALGLSFTFTYDSSGGSGADGLSFFLLNGDTVSSASSVTPGGVGAASATPTTAGPASPAASSASASTPSATTPKPTKASRRAASAAARPTTSASAARGAARPATTGSPARPMRRGSTARARCRSTSPKLTPRTSSSKFTWSRPAAAPSPRSSTPPSTRRCRANSISASRPAPAAPRTCTRSLERFAG